ncbi:MAG: 50S ribosomal protein L25 [Saprospiraceae bacterium]|nr:50S ribosomal protein L25 [Saprospiraceae bacterium]MBP7679979.1 50S ribosomal protein L25 [Saprospiraceae bacterium]
MKSVSITAAERETLGKRSTKDLRNGGLVPCVIYKKEEATHITASPSELKQLIYTPDFKIAEIKVNNKVRKCIIKEATFHPVTDVVTHIEFLELIDGHPVKVEVPLRFKGTSVGVKAGGKLLQTVRKVKIKTLPSNLIDELFLDISAMDLGQSVRIRDIILPSGIEVINSPAIPVATIEIPRALRGK